MITNNRYLLIVIWGFAAASSQPAMSPRSARSCHRAAVRARQRESHAAAWAARRPHNRRAHTSARTCGSENDGGGPCPPPRSGWPARAVRRVQPALRQQRLYIAVDRRDAERRIETLRGGERFFRGERPVGFDEGIADGLLLASIAWNGLRHEPLMITRIQFHFQRTESAAAHCCTKGAPCECFSPACFSAPASWLRDRSRSLPIRPLRALRLFLCQRA